MMEKSFIKKESCEKNEKTEEEFIRYFVSSNFEDGLSIRKTIPSLANVTDLVVNFFTPSDTVLEVERPRKTWSYRYKSDGTYYCDCCGLLSIKLCTLDCIEKCQNAFNLCEKCHNHSEERKEVQDDQEDDQEDQGIKKCSFTNKTIEHREHRCKWCIKNPLLVFQKLLIDLVENQPRSKRVLKNITFVCKDDTYIVENQRRLFNSIFETIGRLDTKPIVFIQATFVDNYGSRNLNPGFISKLFLLVSSSYDNSKDIIRFFNLNMIKNSFIIDIGLVERYKRRAFNARYLKDNIIRPKDNVYLAKQIMKIPEQDIGSSWVNLTKVAVQYAYQLRYNIDLVNNYYNICTILMLNAKYPKKSPIIHGYGTDGIPIIVPNGWGLVNKDIFYLIMSYLHPKDWEIKDLKKRKGRLTIKDPKWAKDTINRYQSSLDILNKPKQIDSVIQCRRDDLKYLKEELEKIQKEIDELPEKKAKLEKDREEAQQLANVEAHNFRLFVQETQDIISGKKKRTRKTRESSKSANKKSKVEKDTKTL